MYKDSLFERYEIFVAAAVIAAHAQNRQPGFRQRDVRFLIELFSNWNDATLDGYAMPVKNTQVLRYLNALVRDGYCRVATRARPPAYRLTRTGLIELLTRCISCPARSNRGHFFFLFYFVRTYKGLLEELVKAEGAQFPYSLRVELMTLLDEKELVRVQMESTKQDLDKLDRRIRDAGRIAQHIARRRREGLLLADIIREVERLWPYELNSQKPLSELLGSIPTELRSRELEECSAMRVECIWKAHRQVLSAHLQALKGLV